MKSVKMSSAANPVRSVAIAIALLGCFITSAATKASAQVGWAVGDGGAILYTSNGSVGNWQKVIAPKVPTEDLKSVYAVDSKTVWAVGESPNPGKAGNPGTIVHFEGKLDNKKNQIWEPQVNGVPDVNLNSVYFLDGKHGWVVGDSGTILYTDDSGQKWTRLKVPANTPDLNGVFVGWYYDFAKSKFFVGGWAVGKAVKVVVAKKTFWQTTILLTTDGTTWTNAANPPMIEFKAGAPRPDARSVFFGGEAGETGWIVGDYGLGIWKTTNGGNAWVQIMDRLQRKGAKPRVSGLRAITGTLNVGGYTLFSAGQGDCSVVEVLSDVWGCMNGARGPGSDDDYRGVAALPHKASSQIWVVGAFNKKGTIIFNPTGGRGNANWKLQTPKDRPAPLNGVVMLPDLNGGVELDGEASPGNAGAGANYVSVTGGNFPAGNIDPSNVVVDLSLRCHSAALAATSAVSVVSASVDSNLISFLLPGGLAPGQYFVSISDSEEGDANFESSNCSAVKVVQ